MAEETLKTAAAASEAPATATEVAVVPEAEKVEATVVCEKEGPPEPEAVVDEPEKVVEEEKEKISESASFKEESNVAGELPDPEKKALDELKVLVQEALNKHEFTAPPAPVKEEEEKPAEEKPAAVVEEESKACDETAVKEESTPEPAAVESSEAVVEKAAPPAAETSEPVAECKEEEKIIETPPPAAEVPEPLKEVTEVVEKVETCVDEDGAKKIEAIQETIVAVTTSSEEPKTEETEQTPAPEIATEETPAAPPPPPEEVSIWGIPLLADERSDVVLLKFLRARDLDVKAAFTMLKSVVAWRKEYGIESLLEEDLGTDHEKAVYMHGVDKEGHPVCYNVYGEYQNKELYNATFSDEEKRAKFLRWRIQFLEKSIRKLDFSPDGICTILQVTDFKNSPGPFKLHQATKQALQILQDNYPEFVAKQVLINVPWWYLAFNKIINPFFTQRSKSKFVYAGASKTAETLFKYIAPELVPVQYGGFSREGEQEFTSTDCVTEEIIKPATKHTIEIPAPETCTLVWEARVVGYEVTYGAEYVPAAEDGYTVIVQKSTKITAATTDEPVICGSFKCGEPGKVVLTFDNQTSKKKKVLYRSKTKVSSD